MKQCVIKQRVTEMVIAALVAALFIMAVARILHRPAEWIVFPLTAVMMFLEIQLGKIAFGWS